MAGFFFWGIIFKYFNDYCVASYSILFGFSCVALFNIANITQHKASPLTHIFALFMTEYFKIGKLVTAFGLKGELILQHNLGKKTSLKGLQAIFVEERKSSFIPWFIEGTRIKTEEEIYLKNLGTKVQTVRLALNIKQNKLALEIGTKNTAIRRIERGEINCGILMLRKIAITLNIPLGELLEEDNAG